MLQILTHHNKILHVLNLCLLQTYVSDEQSCQEWIDEWGERAMENQRREAEKWKEVRQRREAFLAEERKKRRERKRERFMDELLNLQPGHSAHTSAASTPPRLDVDSIIDEVDLEGLAKLITQDD